jgi:hypothetical protein
MEERCLECQRLINAETVQVNLVALAHLRSADTTYRELAGFFSMDSIVATSSQRGSVRRDPIGVQRFQAATLQCVHRSEDICLGLEFIFLHSPERN